MELDRKSLKGILGTSNVFPHTWIKIYNYIEIGNIPSARKILFLMANLLDSVFAEMNPGPLKATIQASVEKCV